MTSGVGVGAGVVRPVSKLRFSDEALGIVAKALMLKLFLFVLFCKKM